MLSGNKIFLVEGTKMYFYVGNIEEFNISYLNSWNEQKLKLYSGNGFFREIKLVKTKNWIKVNASVPENKRDEIWRFETTGWVMLRFEGINNFFSLHEDGMFELLGYHSIISSLVILLSIIACVLALIRKYNILAAILIILILIMPIGVNVAVVEYKIPEINIENMNIRILKIPEVNKRFLNYDVIIIPASKLDKVNKLGGNFAIVPDDMVGDKFFYKYIFESIKKNKILFPNYIPTILLILTILILSIPGVKNEENCE